MRQRARARRVRSACARQAAASIDLIVFTEQLRNETNKCALRSEPGSLSAQAAAGPPLSRRKPPPCVPTDPCRGDPRRRPSLHAAAVRRGARSAAMAHATRPRRARGNDAATTRQRRTDARGRCWAGGADRSRGWGRYVELQLATLFPSLVKFTQKYVRRAARRLFGNGYHRAARADRRSPGFTSLQASANAEGALAKVDEALMQVRGSVPTLH
jgi:hypothetical protein